MSRIHHDGSITLHLRPARAQVPALAYRLGRMRFSDFTVRASMRGSGGGRAILTLPDLPDPHTPLLVSIPPGVDLNSLRHRICELRRGTKYWSLYFKPPPQPNPPGRRASMPTLARHAAIKPPAWPRARP